MSSTSLHDLYRLYSIHFLKEGGMHRILLGTFSMCGDKLHIFSDSHGWVKEHLGHGKITPEMTKKLEQIKRSQYMDLVSEYEVENGYRPDLIDNFEETGMAESNPEPDVNTDDKKKARPAPVWDMFVIGQDEPDRVEVKDKKMYFNGQKCTDAEHEHIMDLLRTGGATLRYPRGEKDPMKLGKMEHFFSRLAKNGPQPGDEAYEFDNLFKDPEAAQEAAEYGSFYDEHWPEIQTAAHTGAISDSAFNATRRMVFEDTLARGIGNKAAYFAHLNSLSKTRQRGTHIIIDGNKFKHINEDLSYAHGDEAIKMYGRAIRGAIDSGIGSESVKAHRFGGDEFCLWVPEVEGEAPEAHQAKCHGLLRDIRTHVEALTPRERFPELNTSHKLSFCAGMGKSPRMANMAIKVAKQAKAVEAKPAGQEGFHVHSLA